MRDKLFLSIYESCKHRPTALGDALELTNTIINAVSRESAGAIIPKHSLVAQTEVTLKRFDPTAAIFYKAYYAKS